MKLPVYYNEEQRLYGVSYYVSAQTFRFGGENTDDNEDFRRAQWIQNYKTYGTNSMQVRRLGEVLKEYLSCDIIVPVPGSTTDKNQMQHDFGGMYFRRVIEVKKSKYNESGVKNGFGSVNFDPKTLEIDFAALDDVGAKRVMLFDDVAKTGRTIDGCRKMFEEAGYEVECAVLGLSWKMIPHRFPYDFFKKGRSEAKEKKRRKEIQSMAADIEEELGISADDLFPENRPAYHLEGNRVVWGEIFVEGFSWDLKSKALQALDEAEDLDTLLHGVPMPDFAAIFKKMIE